MLEITNFNAGYGSVPVLHGVNLKLEHEPLAILGRNGMGKTTLCNALMGMIGSQGSAKLEGVELVGLKSYQVAAHGISLVPQGRRVFPSLTVDEHLRLVATDPKKTGPKNTSTNHWTIPRVYDLFPRLSERRRNGGTQLSGGEQQMLAIARALLKNPKLIVMDEPSEGLAPVIVDHLVETLKHLSLEGMALLLVEQNLGVATRVCERLAIMVAGQIVLETNATELLSDHELQRKHLGVG
jgi:branched-chain amino acid transport system ATP-binding protein